MAKLRWVKIVSWHIVKQLHLEIGLGLTECGRRVDLVDHVLATEFDPEEKTCESCLRLRQ